ncbi:hypothetical protein OCK02_25730 [Rhizobium sp. TRM96647]|jgi:hypothetical protein|nr:MULTISPECIES: hypothetical protein [unclassified Rhizobium]MCV3739532.1 hypothetical protein [Rhizobium sp. TRM96647]MCV3761204.1 hypothetical protein [Rhizobium sp. TRM96650]
MSFVVDASIAGVWLLPDEENEFAAQVMTRMADEEVSRATPSADFPE